MFEKLDHGLSFAYFASPTLEWLGTLFMLSGGLPFVLYIRARRDDLTLLRDGQVRIAIVLGDYLFRRFSPHGVGRGSYDGRLLDDDVIEGVLAFAVIYALAVAVIAVGLGAMDLDLPPA